MLPDNIGMEILFNESMVLVEPSNKFIVNYIQAVENVTGKKSEIISEHGSSDGRFFMAKGIPVIINQPNGDGLHSANEWVNIESLDKYYRILKEFIVAMR
jgi:acetylornithine deacetylase/succinyl-diaminopimelate desuccinylase-like protein